MAVNFPDSPSNGDEFTTNGITFVYNSTDGRWDATGVSSTATTSDTAPTNPTAGDLWFDSSTAVLYIYYNDGTSSQWIGVSQIGTSTVETGITVYSTIDDLPLSGVTEGSQALVDSTDTLYIWSDNGWYKIALINTTPSISNVESSYTLSAEGANTLISIVAEDPEGIPITYSIASDTSGDIATVTQGSGNTANEFTITPSTNTALDGESFSLTFRASDGVNIATAASTFTLTFNLTISNSNYTTALITSVGGNNDVNNDIVDSSTSSHTITVNGDTTQTTFSPYRSGGYSTYFDGTGDYLGVPDDSGFDFDGDFCIELWLYRTGDTSGTYQSIVGGNGNGVNGWNIYITNSTNALGFFFSSFLLSGGTVIDNQWNHIAVTRNGTSLQMFLNGSVVDSATNSTTFTDSTGGGGIRIGYDFAGNGYYQGNIADLRVVKGSAVYTSAFTPPTERLTAITNTSLLTCHLPYIADGSTNDHTITLVGNTKTEPVAPYDYGAYSASYHGGSYYFDETGDWITVTASSDFQLSDNSNPVTVECWVWIDPTESQAGIWELKGSSTDYVRIFLKNTDEVNFKVVSAGSIDVVTTTSPLTHAMWHHVAWVRESDGTFDVYVDGKSVLNGTVPAINDSSSWELNIGNKTVSTDQLLLGHIADFRWVNGTAVYTADFTPPTAPLTAITNTKLLLSGTNAGIIDKSQTLKSLTLIGDAKSSTTQSKYLTSSMYFDGTGDYIDSALDADSGCDFGTGDFTIEGWFYISSLDTYYIADSRNTLPLDAWAIFISSNRLYMFDGSTSRQTTNAPATEQWVHFAITRASNSYRMFLDGSLESGPTSVTKSINAGSRLRLGASGSGTSPLTGYLSDFRITKGLARYTANFTPPTAALEG